MRHPKNTCIDLNVDAIISMETTTIVNGVDISTLSDGEAYELLRLTPEIEIVVQDRITTREAPRKILDALLRRKQGASFYTTTQPPLGFASE